MCLAKYVRVCVLSRSKQERALICHYGWVRCFLSGEFKLPLLYCLEERVVLSNYRSARLGTSRLVTLDLPSALSERVMNALKADPRTVDLRSLAPHFYSLSERILELFEEEELVEVLSNVWCFL